MDINGAFAADFEFKDSGLAESLEKEFHDAEIINGKSFLGTEIWTVIIATSAIYLSKILSFFIKNRELIKSSSIKISKTEIHLVGYSNEELQEMIDKGVIESFKKMIDEKDQ